MSKIVSYTIDGLFFSMKYVITPNHPSIPGHEKPQEAGETSIERLVDKRMVATDVNKRVLHAWAGVYFTTTSVKTKSERRTSASSGRAPRTMLI